MAETFVEMLVVGGKSNSLGRADEVIELVLRDKSRLDELYDCLSDEDPWIRMRAADALEKVCREHPDWLQPYIDRFSAELATSNQPSIQWHLAQIYRQVDLTDEQRNLAIGWLKQLLSSKEVDWIVAANAMDTLFRFNQARFVSTPELTALLNIQRQHRSKSVVRRANKWLERLT
jgi:hypothetical protein